MSVKITRYYGAVIITQDDQRIVLEDDELQTVANVIVDFAADATYSEIERIDLGDDS